MAIIIPHRFADRLLPANRFTFIDTIIIGTFNPGHPDPLHLTESESKIFDEISKSKKFLKFDQVKNFYDRPQNRFWKVMDIIANESFYSQNHIKAKNLDGLKYYSKQNREATFERQSVFCRKNGVFITDIVRQIKPKTFENIYDNFPDKAIENSECTWNTRGILDTIIRFNPRRILINFSVSKTIPKISSEILKISGQYHDRVFPVLSTSGAAGNDYETLFSNWKSHIICQASP